MELRITENDMIFSDKRMLNVFNKLSIMAENGEPIQEMINKIKSYKNINGTKKALDIARMLKRLDNSLHELDKIRLELLGKVGIIQKMDQALNYVLHELLKDEEKIEDKHTAIYWKTSKRLTVEDKDKKSKSIKRTKK